MHGRRWAVAVLVAVVWSAGATSALAQTDADREAARRAILAGNERYGAGDYPGAITHYQAAAARVPSPRIYFNMGMAYRELGRWNESADAFRRFLADAKDAPAEHRREAQARLDEVTRAAAAGSLDVPPPPPAPPRPANRPPPPTAVLAPAPVAAPAPVGAQAPVAAPAPTVAYVAPPAAPAIAPSPAALPPAAPPLASGPEASLVSAPPPAAADETPVTSRWWFWTAIGLVAVGAAVAAVSASSSHSAGPLCPDCDLPTVTVPNK